MDKTKLTLKDGKDISHELYDKHLPHLRTGIRAGVIGVVGPINIPSERLRRYTLPGPLPDLPMPIP